jgi:hypothetical protein
MILDKEWVQMVAERCAEAMTLHLLNATNPQCDDDSCACLNCLSKVAIEVVLDSLDEQSEVEMMKAMHNKNIKKNNVN